MSQNDLYDVTLHWYGRKKNLEKTNEKKEYKKMKIKLSFFCFWLKLSLPL